MLSQKGGRFWLESGSLKVLAVEKGREWGPGRGQSGDWRKEEGGETGGWKGTEGRGTEMENENLRSWW